MNLIEVQILTVAMCTLIPVVVGLWIFVYKKRKAKPAITEASVPT